MLCNAQACARHAVPLVKHAAFVLFYKSGGVQYGIVRLSMYDLLKRILIR